MTTLTSVLLAFAGFGLAAAANSVPAASMPATTVAASKPAPDAAPAELADAGQFRKILDAERGKVVIVNLWATWCSPCLREIPDLIKLQQELAPRGVSLIGLGMDEPDQLKHAIEPFRKKRFPALRSYIRNAPDLDTVVSVVDPAWNEILPTTYILDRKGQIAKKIQGARTYAEFRTLVLAAAGQ